MKAFTKAVKADDVEVPTHLWNDQVSTAGVPKERRDRALTRFRKLGFQLFQKGLVKDCCAFLSQTHGKNWMEKRQQDGEGALTELGRDQRTISSMLWHSSHMSWLEFNTGSRLVHFRFPERYRWEAWNGVWAFFEKPGPTTCWAQPVIGDLGIRSKTKDKIEKVIRRRYLLPAGTPGVGIKLSIKYFTIPKGEDDVRMVYNATANKLNKAVWVPKFWLPTMNTLVRNVGCNLWMTDCNVGDMFLNYQLHYKVWPYTAVELTCLQDSPKETGPEWAVWDRNLMGFAASPYNSIKMALVAEEVCKGDCFKTGVGCDRKELNASRKARPCSQTTGAWAGAIDHVLDELGVCVSTSQEKGTKMRGILTKWRTGIEKLISVCELEGRE